MSKTGSRSSLSSLLTARTMDGLDHPYAVPVLILLLLGGGLFVHLHALINHDIGWYLVAGAQFLDGGRLYETIFIEVNPPLALFLTMPPVLLSKLSGLNAVPLFILYIYGLSVFSLWLCDRFLRLDPAISRGFRHGFLLLFALALTFAIGTEFGQREHMMLAFIMPYILLQARRAAGQGSCCRTKAVLAGALAALGFALKPHYLLLPAALELYRLYRTKDWRAVFRAETITMALVILAYLAAIAHWTPEYLQTVMPYAIESYNAAYRNPFWTLLVRPETLFLPFGFALHLMTRKTQSLPQLADILFLCAGCFFLTYLVQMKGWSYHLYPSSTCLLLGLGVTFFGQTRSQEVSALRRTVTVLALELTLLLAAVHISHGTYKNPFMDEALPLVEKHAADQPIALFGTNVWPGFPLVNYSSASWGMRFPTLWMLPGILQKKEHAAAEETLRYAQIETYVTNSVIEDLKHYRPALVFVDVRRNKSYFGGMDFDYLDYFMQDQRFAAQWQHYDLLDEPFKADGFRIYKRVD
ncbi:MAG: hypothetical protein H6867_00485 [Rhodospirillales bacterium]|nr:hypothetical protein [Rhodospirillales bacterium]MCB9996865.1 hypothetical protein [Rhodospirillales bacterium]